MVSLRFARAPSQRQVRDAGRESADNLNAVVAEHSFPNGFTVGDLWGLNES
jgi:hypothetical protein